MSVIIYLVQIAYLSLLARSIITRIFRLFYLFTRSKRVALWALSLLFFPGTLVHELSHMFAALILFVPFGKLNLWPEMENNGLKLGSVGIASTDPIRRQLIGAAPFVVGNSVLLTVLYFFSEYQLYTDPLYLFLVVLFTFQIGNTMFSSKKDMEGAGVTMLAAIITLGFMIFANLIHFSQITQILTIISEHMVADRIVNLMFIPVIINTIIVAIFSLFDRSIASKE